MTALEDIKKALEGVTHAPGKWEAEGTAVYCDDATGQRVCDTKGEYLFWSEDQKRNAAVYIAAANPFVISELLSTLESLQRENEELRKDREHVAAEKSGIAKNAHSNVDYWKSQFEAAEAEVKRLTASRDGYKLGRDAIQAEYDRVIASHSDEIEELNDKIDGVLSDLDNAVDVAFSRGAHDWVRMNYPDRFKMLSRQNLASTGGEHHGN